jgi:hypothetical protein
MAGAGNEGGGGRPPLYSCNQLLLFCREKDMAVIPQPAMRRRCRPAIQRLAMVFAMLAGQASWQSANAAEPVSLAVASFDFVDTSGEAKDQSTQHSRRLAALDQTIAGDLSAATELMAVALKCADKCSVGVAGIEVLSARAVEAGASHLLIGQVRKMSTLIGGVKFAVIDLSTNKPTCDRFLSYRGDTDEAWARAAAYTAQAVLRHCLP